MWFLHNPGILGLNARNLLYIKPYNPKKAIMMADSKIKTKNFLSARGIPTAKLYGVIHDKKELQKFNWNSLPYSFVLKPNAGFGGEGILIIKGRKGTNWIKENDEILDHEILIRHVNDILDGRFSINDLADQAFFEQRLESPEPFKSMSFKGLPDIRIVVHNLIPVMAMLRLSTRESQGKANIHMGGVGVGIDIAKGSLTYVTQHGKRLDEISNFGSVKGIKIPEWERILLIASRVQQITNLGFAAVDIALDRHVGPVILEINARAGLGVQIANLAPLRRRLQRIEGVTVMTPEKGVRIAQDIFGQKIETKESSDSEKPTIGLLEEIEIIGKTNVLAIAKVDPNLEKSLIDQVLASEMGLTLKSKIKFSLRDVRIQTVMDFADFSSTPFQLILGKRDIRNFLIDPNRTELPVFPKGAQNVITKKWSQDEILKLDAHLAEMDAGLHFLSYLRPLNLEQEEVKFKQDTSYNPQFEYRPLAFDPNAYYVKLKQLLFPDTSLGILLGKKAEEIRRKVELLEARGTDRFTVQSLYLFGSPDFNDIKEAREIVKKMPHEFPKPSRILNAEEAKKIFEKSLNEYGLSDWKVVIKEAMVSDVIAGKENSVMIRKGATFSWERLMGTIAHEIETHVFTAMNGALQPYKIFNRGLAYYLMTEEGLAVYNQERTESAETPKKYWPASSVIGIFKAFTGSFSEVYHEVLNSGFDSERAWKVALKSKRGLKDTSKPGAFTKDLVYFKGHKKIVDFIKQGGDLKDLYYGKINIDDLSLMKQIPHLKEPIYLPGYLRSS